MSRPSALKRIRFNRYCLEDGDEFFEDLVCDYFPPQPQDLVAAKSGASKSFNRVPSFFQKTASSPPLRGRLRLCARSLLFEPDDASETLRMFRFRDMKIENEFEGVELIAVDRSGALNTFPIDTELTIHQMKYGRVLPWVFEKTMGGVQHLFQIPFGDVFGFINSLNALLSVEKLDTHRNEKQNALEKFKRHRDAEKDFPLTSLRSPSEIIYAKNIAHRVLPRIKIRGRIVLTNENLYFQDTSPVDPPAVLSIKLKDIRRVERRRYALRDMGMEIAMYDDTVMLFALEDNDACESVYLCLGGKCGIDRLRVNDVHTMQTRWLSGECSNFDYLMYLNWISGRSVNDLSQYPVLPWVLSDYTSSTLNLTDPRMYRDLSLPIGALNPKRLESFYARMDPHENNFLYGTHFSNPAYVAYFLVRTNPEFMLSLHGGKYDNPARMFESVPDCWDSVSRSPTDLKELTPEFYVGDGAFLTSADSYDLQLGTKPSGVPVARDVVLPPWAENSPKLFVRTMRLALESMHVSTHLHEWIDLMFGSLQRDISAHNLFHPYTYDVNENEEASDQLATTHSLMVRASMETHAVEVGQMPKQIFTTRHPRRNVATPEECISFSSHVAFDSDDLGRHDTSNVTPNQSFDSGACVPNSPLPPPQQQLSIKLRGQTAVHKTRIEAIVAFPMLTSACQWWMDDDDDDPTRTAIVTLTSDVTGNVFFTNAAKVQRARSTPTTCGTVTLSCVCVTDPTKENHHALVGSHNGSMYLVDVLTGRVATTVAAHNTGLTSIARTSINQNYVATASWNGSVRVWSLKSSGASLVCEWDHDDCVSAVDFGKTEGNLLSVLTTSGNVFLYDMRTESLVRSWRVDPSAQYAQFLKDEYVVVVSHSDIRLYDVHDGRMWSERSKDYAIKSVCVGPSPNQLLLYDDQARMHCVNCITGVEEAETITCDDDITCLHTSSDYVVAGHAGGVVSFYQLRT